VCTGFVILRALPEREMETIARELWSIFALMGIPRIIQSDNGTEFVNQVVRTLVKVCGIEHRLISAYNPRTDGKVERMNRTVKDVIKKILHGLVENWPLYVDYAQLSVNAKIASLTNSSPFALMFGRRLNPLRDYTVEPVHDVNIDEWKDHQDKIAALILPAISDRVLKVKTDQVKRLDKLRRQLLPSAFPNGASVMILNINRQNKFDPNYVGPFIIERRARSGNYVLRDATGDILDRRVPADQLKLISRVPVPKDNEEPIYVVRKILDHRGSSGNYEYLVDWKNHRDHTWEPEGHFLDPDPLKVYWENKNGASGTKKKSRRRL
jgi:hypothetical protein